MEFLQWEVEDIMQQVITLQTKSDDSFLMNLSHLPYGFILLYLAAARALIDQPLDAEQIARKAMEIAADMCVYTNNNFMVETMSTEPSTTEEDLVQSTEGKKD